MKKIDICLVKKYVNGEELGEYSLDQLENDKDFMMSVISYSNDSKIYNLCSDEVKKDYDFVKYLIFKFREDLEFITKVADYYLDNTDTEIESMELNVLMTKLLPNELFSKYDYAREIAYYAKRVEIEIAKVKDPNLESLVGEGFLLIFDSYSCSDIILEYYAESMISDIMRDNNINFESMLHNQFKTPDKIDEIGINNYIINLMGYYDSMLSSYVSTHLDLIKNIRNKIRSIQINWNRYNIADEEKRYNNMLCMVHDYMEISESSMSETEILYYVAAELGIKDKVAKYDNPYPIDEEPDFDFEEAVDGDMVKYEIENNLKERMVYLNVRKIMLNQLFSSNPNDLYSIIGGEKKKEVKSEPKGEIIMLNPHDKK